MMKISRTLSAFRTGCHNSQTLTAIVGRLAGRSVRVSSSDLLPISLQSTRKFGHQQTIRFISTDEGYERVYTCFNLTLNQIMVIIIIAELILFIESDPSLSIVRHPINLTLRTKKITIDLEEMLEIPSSSERVIAIKIYLEDLIYRPWTKTYAGESTTAYSESVYKAIAGLLEKNTLFKDTLVDIALKSEIADISDYGRPKKSKVRNILREATHYLPKNLSNEVIEVLISDNTKQLIHLNSNSKGAHNKLLRKMAWELNNKTISSLIWELSLLLKKVSDSDDPYINSKAVEAITTILKNEKGGDIYLIEDKREINTLMINFLLKKDQWKISQLAVYYVNHPEINSKLFFKTIINSDFFDDLKNGSTEKLTHFRLIFESLIKLPPEKLKKFIEKSNNLYVLQLTELIKIKPPLDNSHNELTEKIIEQLNFHSDSTEHIVKWMLYYGFSEEQILERLNDYSKPNSIYFNSFKI